jgi:hypothetical protein
MKPTKHDALKYVRDLYRLDSLIKRHNTQTHIAMLVKRGKVIQIAHNSIGSRSKGCGYDNYTIHAERAVIKKLGNLRQLEGAYLMVIRISKSTRQVLNSEPCHTCRCHLEKCIKEYGLRCVYYS